MMAASTTLSITKRGRTKSAIIPCRAVTTSLKIMLLTAKTVATVSMTVIK